MLIQEQVANMKRLKYMFGEGDDELWEAAGTTKLQKNPKKTSEGRNISTQIFLNICHPQLGIPKFGSPNPRITTWGSAIRGPTWESSFGDP